jgi:hypothetical protein
MAGIDAEHELYAIQTEFMPSEIFQTRRESPQVFEEPLS